MELLKKQTCCYHTLLSQYCYDDGDDVIMMMLYCTGSNQYAAQRGMKMGTSRDITQHEDEAVATVVVPQQSGVYYSYSPSSFSYN